MKGNIDLDNDGHPDLIVGAKDLAVVLRARPIISISSEITVTGKFERDIRGHLWSILL